MSGHHYINTTDSTDKMPPVNPKQTRSAGDNMVLITAIVLLIVLAVQAGIIICNQFSGGVDKTASSTEVSAVSSDDSDGMEEGTNE